MSVSMTSWVLMVSGARTVGEGDGGSKMRLSVVEPLAWMWMWPKKKQQEGVDTL